MITHEVTMGQAERLLPYYLARRQPAMLWGSPGIGKSQLVYQMAANAGPWVSQLGALGEAAALKRAMEQGVSLIDYRVSLRDPVDMMGIPVPCPETGRMIWLNPDELPQVDRDGHYGLLFTDEINAANSAMMAACLGLVLDGKIGGYRLPPGWIVVAAGNKTSDRASAQRMSSALLSRFANLYVSHDVPSFTRYANRIGMRQEIVAFLRFRLELLYGTPSSDGPYPTPRGWERVAGYLDTPDDVRMHLIAGLVGADAAAQICAFMDLYKTIQSLDDIIADPVSAAVPQEASLRWAVVTGLGRMAKRSNMDSIVTYAQRLPREAEVMLVHDAVQRDETCKNTAAFGQWAARNASVLI